MRLSYGRVLCVLVITPSLVGASTTTPSPTGTTPSPTVLPMGNRTNNATASAAPVLTIGNWTDNPTTSIAPAASAGPVLTMGNQSDFAAASASPALTIGNRTDIAAASAALVRAMFNQSNTSTASADPVHLEMFKIGLDDPALQGIKHLDGIVVLNVKESCEGAGLNPIMNPNDCVAAAKKLPFGLKEIEVTHSGSNRPSGCMIYTDHGQGPLKLEFNPRETGWADPNWADLHSLCLASQNCLEWRQTTGCSYKGPREPENDRPCDWVIPGDVSGYCRCNGESRNVQDCGKPAEYMTCNAACAAKSAKRNADEDTPIVVVHDRGLTTLEWVALYIAIIGGTMGILGWIASLFTERGRACWWWFCCCDDCVDEGETLCCDCGDYTETVPGDVEMA